MAANVVSGSGDSNKMLGRELPMFIIDAFSGEPFSGNPAAVCLVGDEDLSDEIKQKIAAEMNLSETAFIRALSPADDFDKACRFGLRWWTPTNEVNLCGHATMASAAALFNIVGNGSPQLEFETRSGTLIAKKQDECITIDLPLNPCTEEDPSSISDLIKATLGDIEPQDVQYAPGANKDLLLRVPDSMTRATLESLKPDTTTMMKVHNTGRIMGVILTLKGSKENGAVDAHGKVYDFISRYFAPWNGIPEDPFTGAAHTVLSPYWSEKLGKKQMYARQCSARGGDVNINVRNDGRVDLSGKATTVMQGKIFV
ncbi:phenazine biosynthesis-like domain-containing protein isoform X2 [Amphiura filiformis]|uniref:phenazine biosynthesis-like domain-containing protein isoform X2 n=1 Tax=Amphiura filiformis TaxID=82378 RepID=UPI003B219A74